MGARISNEIFSRPIPKAGMSRQLILMDSIACGTHETVREAIVKWRSRVTDLHDHGLYLALQRSPFDPEVLAVLLENGADPNVEIRNIRGAFTTPLHCCPNAHAMLLLVQHGAKFKEPQLVADYLLSAYHTALNRSAKSVADVDLLKQINFLIKAGAPISEEPPNALSPSPAFMLEELRKLYPWLGH